MCAANQPCVHWRQAGCVHWRQAGCVHWRQAGCVHWRHCRGQDSSSPFWGPSPTLSPTDPVPRGVLTLCPWASSGPQGLYTAYMQPICSLYTAYIQPIYSLYTAYVHERQHGSPCIQLGLCNLACVTRCPAATNCGAAGEEPNSSLPSSPRAQEPRQGMPVGPVRPWQHGGHGQVVVPAGRML